MLFMQSMLLWVLAACALIMIMHYVLKSPRTPERPEFGLGKRYRVGGRGVKRKASSRTDDEIDFAPESPYESATQISAPSAIPVPKQRQNKPTAQTQWQNETPAKNYGRGASRAPAEEPKFQHQGQDQGQVTAPASAAAPYQNPVNADTPSAEEAPVQKPKRRTVTMQNMLNKAMSDRR